MHTTQSAPSILLHPTPRSALADETIADLTNEALFEAAASPALPPPASPARNITAGHARNFVYPYHLSEHSVSLCSSIKTYDLRGSDSCATAMDLPPPPRVFVFVCVRARVLAEDCVGFLHRACTTQAEGIRAALRRSCTAARRSTLE
eukprot:SAG31_NODE_493_length_14893_cov_20.429701_7_plen_148_part_00